MLDGGGKVTLSGQGRRRILYMNTCDPAQVLDHLALPEPGPPAARRRRTSPSSDGNATGENVDGGGGGAIFVRGGRFTIDRLDASSGNRCDRTGPDVGGAAVRVLSQYHGLPVYVVGQHLQRRRAPVLPTAAR